VSTDRATTASSATESALRIVWIYPDLLSTYGDRGNMLILARRAELRGLPPRRSRCVRTSRVPTKADILSAGWWRGRPAALAAQR